MSEKSFGEMLRELDDLFEEEHNQFVDDFIENKARPHVMMYFRDWFDEEVAPALREALDEEKPEVQYAKRLAGFLSGVRDGVQGFVMDVMERYVDVPDFTVKREPVGSADTEDLDEESLVILAAIQHSIDNHGYDFLNQEILTDITGYNSNLIFDHLRKLETEGFIERVLPDEHPPGIHHLRKRYNLKRRLDAPDRFLNPLSVNEVMDGVADDLAAKVHRETKQRPADKLLDAVHAVGDTLRSSPLEIRQEAYEKIRKNLNQ